MKTKKTWQLIITVILLSVLVTGCATQKQKQVTQQGKVYYVQTSPANMLVQLKTGEIDAFVAWEPFNAQAIKEGCGRYLMQSGEIAQEHPCCILAITQAKANGDLPLSLTWANTKAINFINDPDYRDKVIKYAMDFTGKDQKSVIEALPNVKYVNFPNVKQFELFLSNMHKNGTLVKTPESMGYKDDQAFFKDFLDNKYVNRVNTELKNNPSWVPPAIDSSRNVNLGYINQDLHHLPMYIAEQEGYYKQIGLNPGQNLQLKGFANGVAVMEAFKVKELTASYLGGAPAILKRLNDGVTIKAIAGVNNEGSAIVVAKNSSIKSFKDLNGKTVAIPSLGSVQSYILSQAALQNNLILQAK
jgi:NitT/TauT family transport system substrate-binding protein